MALGTEEFGTALSFLCAGFLFLHLLFMSVLTLGLLSIRVREVAILKFSGTDTERKQAAGVLPIVQKNHQLFVTLVICVLVAMRGFCIYLDKNFLVYVKVTALVFCAIHLPLLTEVTQHRKLRQYGLAMGAKFIWLIQILMIVCFPIAYPTGKILDVLIGNCGFLLSKTGLKAFIASQSQEAGKGGKLKARETRAAIAALSLSEQTVEQAMTPIESTFSLDVDSELNCEVAEEIISKGYSRVPVYSGNPTNIIGFLMVENLCLHLLGTGSETRTRIGDVSINKILRVPASMSLLDIRDILREKENEMVAVVKPHQVIGIITLQDLMDVLFYGKSLKKR